MANDDDNDDVIIDDESGVTRWVPAAVVTIALLGFISLAWYAYHSGTQSIKDEDLLVVEADSTPMKEKPLDPGGMKFPNQDKTIFETFANNSQTPPNVERVMPAPEEPMPKEMDTSETKTWINDKLKENGPPQQSEMKTEQVIGTSAEKKQEAPAAAAPTGKIIAAPKEVIPSAGEGKPTAQVADSREIITHVKTEKKPEEKKVEEKKAEVKPAAAPKAETKPAAKESAGAAKIQLGAYASEEEAKNAWSKIQKKFPELGNKTVYVVKADLGAKGIFYRLRAGNVGSASDAKALCSRLSAKGQACLVP